MSHQQVEPVVARQPTRIDRDISKCSAQRCDIGSKRIESKHLAIQVAIAAFARTRLAADQRECGDHQLGDFPHQSSMIPADAIPLQHAELGIVVTSRFAEAKHAAQFVAIADTGREQALERELWRRAQPAPRLS